MAITTNIDLIVTYDLGQLVSSTRILAPTDTQQQEHAAQCCMIEILRDIMATGMTLADWNSSAEPWAFQGQDWDTWWAARVARGRDRAALNIAAPVPGLSQGQLDQASNMASNFFERGYAAVMSGTQQVDKMTFTRTGGL